MRALFVIGMICSVVILGGAAVFLYFAVWTAWNAGEYVNIRSLISPTVLLLGAGACGAGIFMSPREFKEATKPLEEETVERPAWLDELAKPAEAPKDSDRRQ